MDFGCGSKASNIVTIYFYGTFKEGESLLAKNVVVVVDEFNEFPVQFSYFLLQTVRDVLVNEQVA